ncbi:MAG TPA: hypothetical protein VEA77_05745 [Hyphomicrobium sp.]|nr:hypothetical protein [Hyphomicrobium sp.]
MTSHIVTKTFGLLAIGLAFALPAAAADNVAQKMPSAEACTKTVGALGAAMSHTSEVGPDGRPVFRFVLRTNGLDYEAVCEAETGVVRDVTPRMVH